MTYWNPNPAQRVQGARQALEAARQGMSALSREHDAALREPIENAGDLSAEGLRKAKDERAARLRDAAERQLSDHAARIDAARSDLEAVRDAEPAPNANQLARQAQHWSRSRALLEAGKSPRAIIDGATDPDHLQALRAELPTWLEAQSVARNRSQGLNLAPYEAPDTSRLVRAIDSRLSEVGAGAVRDAAAARVALSEDVPVADAQHAGTAGQVAGHHTGLTTAIGAALAGA